MSVCHSVFRSKEFRSRFEGKTVLCYGTCEDRIHKIARGYGYTKENNIQYLSVVEYVCLYSDEKIALLADVPELSDYFKDIDNYNVFDNNTSKDLEEKLKSI